jgi:hypothetical protein
MKFLFSRRFFLVFLCLLVIFSITGAIFTYYRLSSKTNDTTEKTVFHDLNSRKWMEFSMDLVRKNKPTPPESSRFYAYVSSVYFDVLNETDDQQQASEATRKVLSQLSSEDGNLINDFAKKLYEQPVMLNEKAQDILDKYLDRELHDGMRELEWDTIIPKGDGNWVFTNKQPYSPRAGEWKRWILTDLKYDVPAPPVFNSAEDLAELKIVKKAASERDAFWNEKIIFWQGIPGTEAPAGIWQNIMFQSVKDTNLDDLSFAKEQKILAQSIADSFLECWKVKFVYWTARPSMRIPGLVTSMPDPPFPSYLSGHSTISRTAAEVLSKLYPEKKDYWLTMADEAKQSRLYAGIHFDVDNQQGAILGQKISADIINTLNL